MEDQFLFKKIIDKSWLNYNNIDNKKTYDYKKKENSIILKDMKDTFLNKYSLNPSIFLNINAEFKNTFEPEVVYLENILTLIIQVYYYNNIDLKLEIKNIDYEIKIENKTQKKITKKRKKRKNSKKKLKNKNNNVNNNTITNLTIGNLSNKDNFLINIKFLWDLDDKSYSFDDWNIKEIAIFETFFLKYGKKFSILSKILKNKNLSEIEEFYKFWKLTSHYKMYKFIKNQIKQDYIKIWN